MNKKIGIWIFALFLLGSFVFAEDLYYRSGQDVNIKVPCFNEDNYCSENTNCSLTLVNPASITIIQNQSMEMVKGYSEYNISYSLLGQIGEYKTTVLCNDQGDIGKSQFDIIITDENINYSNTLVLVIGLGIVIFLLAYIGISLDKEHFLLKLLLLMVIFPMLSLIPKSIIWGQNSLTLFLSITIWINRLFFTYIFLYFVYIIFGKKLVEKFSKAPKQKVIR